MINSIGPQIPITPPSPSTSGSGRSQTAFVQALKSAVDHVEISGKAAAKSVEAFLV